MFQVELCCGQKEYKVLRKDEENNTCLHSGLKKRKGLQTVTVPTKCTYMIPLP